MVPCGESGEFELTGCLLQRTSAAQRGGTADAIRQLAAVVLRRHVHAHWSKARAGEAAARAEEAALARQQAEDGAARRAQAITAERARARRLAACDRAEAAAKSAEAAAARPPRVAVAAPLLRLLMSSFESSVDLFRSLFLLDTSGDGSIEFDEFEYFFFVRKK